MRGYLWQDLPSEIIELTGYVQPHPPLTSPEVSKLIAADIRLREGETRAAQERLGAEWWRKVIAYARRRNGDKGRQSQSLKRAAEVVKGRPRGGALTTPRLEEQRAKERQRAAIRQNREKAMRERLPDLRPGITWHFTIHTREGQEVDGYLTTGEYPNGKLGEIWVKMGKNGDERAWIDQWAALFSLLLQHRVPLEKICKKLIGQRFEPAGATGSGERELARCTSIVDLLGRFLLKRYGAKEEQLEAQP